MRRLASCLSSYHVGVWEVVMILVMLGVLVVIAAPWIMRRFPTGGAGWQSGTMLVTGVSPRPDDVTGEQFVTITGVINGPTVAEHVVYQRLAVDVNQWPTMGQLFPVAYSAKNPDNWRFTADAPPPPPPPGPIEY
jgi:hypothetical protein